MEVFLVTGERNEFFIVIEERKLLFSLIYRLESNLAYVKEGRKKRRRKKFFLLLQKKGRSFFIDIRLESNPAYVKEGRKEERSLS